MPKTIADAAKLAIEVQDACNLSGVAASLYNICSDVLWPEANRLGKGTDFVNGHPIVTMFLSKLASLNGTYLECDYHQANKACEALAQIEASCE
jgi:hypothetical protein